MLRRILLAGLTALIVARPLVLGEDPGLLLSRLSDASGLVLTLAWLMLAVGWAAWCAWSKQEGRTVNAVEMALAGVVLLIVLSAAFSVGYKHPAWLISWEWLVLFLVYFLVRRLPRRDGDSRRLLAAVLATGVSLSVYALYQYRVELPQMRQKLLASPNELRKELAREGVYLEADDPQLHAWVSRIQANNVYATYAHPNSFAGYLALLLPAAIGWAIASGYLRGPSWSTALACAAALVMAFALWVTHSRGAILGTALVGLGVGIKAWRDYRPVRRYLLAGLVVAVVAGGAFWLLAKGEGLERARGSFGLRLDYWRATEAMITDPAARQHFWLGVGPGNFGRLYPRYLLPAASEKIADPHNFLLELWATSGVFAVLLLLTAVAVFFWTTRKAWTAPLNDEGTRSPSPTPEREGAAAIRWEFYLGGMAGLLLGFALSAFGQSPDEIIVRGLAAGARSILWFGTFALLENIAWRGSSRARALAAGVAALLLNLLVSGGISQPSVAQPLWIMAALAWNSLPFRADSRRVNVVARLLPLPLLGAAALAYLLFFFMPVMRCVSQLQLARGHYAAWSTLRQEMERRRTAPGDERLRKELHRLVLDPLERAAAADPTNVIPWNELAGWYETELSLLPRADLCQQRPAAEQAIDRIVHLDPEGKEGYLALYRLNVLMAGLDTEQAKTWFGFAASAMKTVVACDPTDSRLRYQWADALFRAGDRTGALGQAAKAREFDHLSTDSARQLSTAQREQVRKWLASER